MAELNQLELKNDVNLQGYWRFESGALVADSSGNSNTLTNNNTVTEGTGKYGGAADFEISNTEYFSITDGDQTGLDITGDISFSKWLKLEQLPSTAGASFDLITKWNGTGNQRGYRLGVNTDNKLYFFYSGDGISNTNIVTTGAVFDAGDVGNWVHLVITADVSDQDIKVYKDTVSQAGTITGTQSAIYNNTSEFQVGGIHVLTVYYDGLMDDVCVFSRVLTDAEILKIYKGGAGAFFNLL